MKALLRDHTDLVRRGGVAVSHVALVTAHLGMGR
jgi:hypothetical protein